MSQSAAMVVNCALLTTVTLYCKLYELRFNTVCV